MGVRLITLTHDSQLDWCINWKDDNPDFHGLNDLGREMIDEMNRLGIIIDLSHSAASTVEEVLKASNQPVIASHSCAASICPHKRNLTDDQIRAIAEKGGMIGVAFVSFFLDKEFSTKLDEFSKKYADEMKALMRLFSSEMDEESKRKSESEYSHVIEEFERTFQPIRPGIGVVADHIDHIVNLVGADHVGIGSDFDGMEMPPVGLDDCAGMPNLTRELVNHSYSEDDIRKILGGNFMRVFKQVCD
jgi:membrane dipeptidase